MPVDNHQIARQLAQHSVEVRDMRKRASHWRLTDCDEPTLDRMRLALIEEMMALKQTLAQADLYLTQCIEASDPLETEASLERINRISAEWKVLNTHLQEIDDAILERHLRSRLVTLFRSEQAYLIAEIVLLVAIFVAISLTLVELFVPTLPDTLSDRLFIFNTGIAFFLLADFFLRLYLSEDRAWYWRKYWIDFVASLPFVGVLRVGRLIHLIRFGQLLRLLRLSRALRAVSFAFRGYEQLTKTLQVTLLKRSVLIAVVLLILGAFAIGAVEQGGGTSVDTLNESLWWSFTTVVTGGFADLYNPQSLGGRVLTVGLVLIGFTITSIFTASLTSILVGDDSSRIEQNQHVIEAQLTDFRDQLDRLSRESNESLIALETIAQKISNCVDQETLFSLVSTTMIDEFDAIQVSVHLMEGQLIRRVSMQGLERATPLQRLAVGDDFLGRIAAELMDEDFGRIDIEPIKRPFPQVRGVRMALPLVAHQQLLGFVHMVLPENLGRYFAYNRAPMTLVHHAALAIVSLE